MSLLRDNFWRIMALLNKKETNRLLEEEPLSPGDRLFHEQGMNTCILCILGFKTKITNIDKIKYGIQTYFMNQSRFHSVLVAEKNKWMETEVDIEKHVINVEFEPKMEGYTTDEFLENYMTNLSTKSMDITKPLWELHVFNFKTCNANSTILFRVHHSMGDGLSLISLLLSHSFQTSNPQALPSFPTSSNKSIKKQQVIRKNNNNYYYYSSSNISRFMKWLLFTMLSFFMLIFNTFVDVGSFLATISFLKDTKTPIKGAAGVELSPRRFIHRIISFDDIKMVKTALNMTVNDVLVGITQGGISHYLNRRCASNNKNEEKALEQKTDFQNNIRLRAAVVCSQKTKNFGGVMEKESKVKMGNSIGFVLLPLTVDLLDDPIDYIRLAKSQMDRKKLSLEARCSHFVVSILPKFIGFKFVSAITYRALLNTTVLFSNIPGPTEEISMFELPLAYIAPSTNGLPQALTIHYQSYCNKMVIAMGVDLNLIPDPHVLCDDIENCLNTIKQTIM